MSDTNSASVLSDERLAILAVNPTEANNALGKEVRAMALELQSRRAVQMVRSTKVRLHNAVIEMCAKIADAYGGQSPCPNIAEAIRNLKSPEGEKK